MPADSPDSAAPAGSALPAVALAAGSGGSGISASFSPAALFHRWEGLILILFVAVVTWASLGVDGFANSSNVSFLLLDVTEIALMALTMTLVIVAAEIDLSVASTLGLSCAVLGWLWNAGLPIEAIMPICLVAGALCGALNGFLVTRLGLPSLAVTIGTFALYRGLAYVILGDQAVADLPPAYTSLAGSTLGPIPVATLLVAVLAVLFVVILHFTSLGRSIVALGSNEEAAFFSGVRVKRIRFWLFVASGAMAALASLIFTFRYASARADNGAGLELAVIAAVLLGGVSIFGGRGTLPGVLMAVLLLGVVRNALILADVANEVLNFVTGLLLVASVLAPNLGAVWRRRTSPPLEGKSAP
ncbi:sugar ABC transporter permease [Acrocarpospora pleiomorpha]|uniref:Autoinducer 2 import system permease protein LsrD n=1 Tax=Acrocarpospora pleiomorpha TaxID=90975 RepID=A0A5M3XF72_9ACTN|nr:ABC transporter permease [Acrocarpospora pleiomorpha]GES19306.1 sugar ABC transporter permease [Acrocarpospora pleiomorpha]